MKVKLYSFVYNLISFKLKTINFMTHTQTLIFQQPSDHGAYPPKSTPSKTLSTPPKPKTRFLLSTNNDVLSLDGFVDKGFVNVWNNSSSGNGSLDKGVKLFISSDSKL